MKKANNNKNNKNEKLSAKEVAAGTVKATETMKSGSSSNPKASGCGCSGNKK